MALLQISEPGQSPDPHQRRIAVGIDLGTTHSLVAAVRNGVAECLPDNEGRVLLPSVVRYLEQGKRQIGYDAVAAQSSDARNTMPRPNASWAAACRTWQRRDSCPMNSSKTPTPVQAAW